jgi:hypothetical protein
MRVALLTIAAVLACASPALAAGTVTRFSETSGVTYATAGPANVVVTDAPSGAGTAMTISEPGIQPGGTFFGCVDNGDSITCTFADPADASISTTLSAMNDVFNAGASTRTEVTVQDFMGGDDVITGGNLAVRPNGSSTGDVLRPGPGTDQVFGGGGNDELGDGGEGNSELVEGGPGDDRFIVLGFIAPGGDPVGDVYRGGPGRDSLYVRTILEPPESFTIDLAAGAVTEASGIVGPDVAEGFEDARTDEGADTLLGTDGPNILRSGAGNDRIVGLLGSDELSAEAGEDRLEARDGVADRVDGGPGGDSCQLDQLDESAECETIDLATLTPFGAVLPDLDPPGCRVAKLKRSQRRRQIARRGLRVIVDCDEPGRVGARLLGKLRRLDGRARVARAGDVQLAGRTATLGSGDRATLRLRVARRLRGLLRPRARLRLELTPVDKAGNRARPLVRRLRLR